ncbi:MAG: methylenetetrahydrofolate--tRNA-(uracil(54)-C(5))-methyltransferase (FADH(2)-oxidizing) TrmFO [Thermodesulfobacteriota bacterium]
MTDRHIKIIGAGLAGCEAAYQAATQGCSVHLHEMKPKKFSPAHHSPSLAELVCSNSLRSNAPTSAVGLLKEEMRSLDSLLIKIADETAVPAGQALAVDRDKFAARVSRAMEDHPKIEIIHGEESALATSDPETPLILATGPLTSEKMAESLAQVTGRERLAFYDAIAPIVTEESLDMDIIYSKSRWEDGPGDYLNCPMDKEQYLAFISALDEAKTVPLKAFEEEKYFEGCLPIEVMCGRGEDTLRYGPMKPVGLRNPRTGQDPYAVVQLRMENREGSLYNLVGFQTKLTYPEQKRIFRMIPGLEKVDFARLGSIHRNTFVCAPELLAPSLQLKDHPHIYLAGQLSGVEGYVESMAMGLLAGLNASRSLLGKEIIVPPPETALGALIKHLTQTDPACFQPSNVNFGLFPPWEKKVPKKLRGAKRRELSLAALDGWRTQLR